MEDLRASRQRRRAEAMAWMERARKEMAERADLRKEIASTPAGDNIIAKKREVKVALSLVSLEWRKAHEDERCSFLFPEVFPLLFQSGHLETEDVLKFRLLSKQSKDLVDLHLPKKAPKVKGGDTIQAMFKKYYVVEAIDSIHAKRAKSEGPCSLVSYFILEYVVTEASAIPAAIKNANDCGPSVGELDLNLLIPTVEFSEPILKGLSLELPHLKSFRFYASRVNLDSIDFLLPCRSLKRIRLRYSKKVAVKNFAGPSTPAPPGDVIQFSGYVNRLYESNVWELFPDLELVSIEDDTFPATGPVWGVRTMPDPLTVNASFDTKVKLYTRDGFLKGQLNKD